MTLIYIAGYAVHKVSNSTNCESCLQEMQYGQTLEIEEVVEDCCNYLKFIDRGGLKKPKPYVVNILVVMLQLFKYTSMTSRKYEEEFLKKPSQRQFFFQLSIEIINENNLVPIVKCSSCKNTDLRLVKKITWIFSNILLNNYSKAITVKIILLRVKNQTNEK